MKSSSTPVLFALVVMGAVAGCGTSDVAIPAGESAASITADPQGGIGDVEPVPVEDFVAAEPTIAGGFCALDAVNGGDARSTSVKAGTEVWFSGWVADDDKQVPEDAMVVFRGEGNSYSIPVIAGVARPDVAKALSSDALATSGYNLLARVDMIPGSYALAIVSGISTAAQKECDLDARMLVVE